MKTTILVFSVLVICLLTSLTFADISKIVNKSITTNKGSINIVRTITRNCEKEDGSIECVRNMYREITIERIKDNETIIRTKNVTVIINGEIETDDNNKTYFKIENKTREVKIMPDTASATAIARLKIKVCNESNNCTIVLKDVGKKNTSRIAYVVKAWKERRFLFWKWKTLVQTQIDAETGDVIRGI